jgi:hypothetical protein
VQTTWGVLGLSVALALTGCRGPARDTSTAASDASQPADDGALAVADGGDPGAQATDAGPGDQIDDMVATFMQAPHPDFPQIPDHGGPIVAGVQLITVTFAGYPFESDVQSFGDFIVASQWVANVGQEYGVGPGAHVAHAVLPSAPAVVTHTDIEGILIAAIESHVLPAPAKDSVYAVYFPASTTVKLFAGDQGCLTSYGYHYSRPYEGQRLTYFAIPDCSALDPTVDYHAILYPDASHELIETLTDPSMTDPAYLLESAMNAWSQFGGEVADECAGLSTNEAGYTLTRVWSNQAAASGQDPCQPASPSAIVYDVAPSQTVVTIAAGHSATISLMGWSSAPKAPWWLTAYMGYESAFNPKPQLGGPVVSFGPTVGAGTTITNGQTTTLTLSVPAGAQSGSIGSVFIDSFDQQPPSTFTSLFLFPRNDWPILIRVQ